MNGHSILVMGEVLWDIFGEEKKIGGASFNFAAHLAALGDRASFLSGVGRDELGEAAVQEMKRLNISDRFVDRSEYPTGACHVTLQADGTPKYDLLAHTAYDHPKVEQEQLAAIRGEAFEAFYFGTLARREQPAQEAARKLLSQCHFPLVFFDINVRQPFISRETANEGLQACTHLKISREECGLLPQLGLAEAEGEGEAFEKSLCRSLAVRYPNIQAVILTQDKQGAMLYDANEDEFLHSIRPKNKLVSAVGAGDSFSAAFLHNLLCGRSLQQCLDRGVLLSDYVVTQLGAVPECPQELREKIV